MPYALTLGTFPERGLLAREQTRPPRFRVGNLPLHADSLDAAQMYTLLILAGVNGDEENYFGLLV